MEINKKFWENKNILVTGQTGFKGSWLSCILKSFNCKLWGLSDGIIKSDNYRLLGDTKVFEDEFTLDISQPSSELNAILKQRFDFVFHLAAQGLVSVAQQQPRHTINSNIIGTYNILDAINKLSDTPCIIISTTDKVYANPSHDNVEESPLGGDEFYSATKAASEHIIRAFINSQKRTTLNIGIVRSGNVLGGGDGARDRIVTDVMNSLKNNEEIVLRNPNAVRPWQYIMDSLHGYILTAQYCFENKTEETFNLNSEKNNRFTVRDVTKSLVQHWEKNHSNNIIEIPSELNETAVLTINSRKANNLLGWSAIHDVNSITKNIINWEKARMNGKNLTFEQIREHYSLVG